MRKQFFAVVTIPFFILIAVNSGGCEQSNIKAHESGTLLNSEKKINIIKDDTTRNRIEHSVPKPIHFSLSYKLPATVPLNVSFTFDNKAYNFYGHGTQYSEIDGKTALTEFGITAEIFPELNYDYGDEALPDGISFSVNDQPYLNNALILDNDKTYLKLKGLEYKQESGLMVLTAVVGNLISGTFSMSVRAKSGKLSEIKDGTFKDVPVKKYPTENE